MNGDKILRIILIVSGLFYILLAKLGEEFFKYHIGNQGLLLMYVVFAVSALYLATDRNYYLPFLDDAVFPDGLFPPNVTPMSANMQHTITNVPKNTKIIYWAAEPCDLTETCGTARLPWDAYNDYTNAGITMSNSRGHAVIKIRGKPQGYNVPYKSKVIMPHIHYRYHKKNGMYSQVHTVYLN